ncbi:alpha/beta hydrolase [Arsenicicoccus dermatophilus]|uniref:alpha/beta hydrolase n=1 Tax=Arsenicicoccus dermatophilus TaxID=1076331 RepID=UPI001F4CE065|nr:alpha/beta hydrolase [Arsenicicoccus dermatophilus]MCH8611878.1 alpha/beta hydrolase [Arsenicicoccus dermatophilus]
MTRLDLRVRLLGAALRTVSVSRSTPEQVIARQGLGPGHHPLTDRLFGGLLPAVTVTDIAIPAGDHQVPVRVYRPDRDGTLPLVLLVHGGGWVAGDLDGYDWIGSSVATGVGAVVISVDYRLAPTHRWPVAAEDCYAALLAAVTRAAEWGADPTRLAVIGDSAGGNLAAVLTLMARDRSGPAIAAQVLVYPSTDLDSETRSMVDDAHAPILDQREALVYRDLYVPREQDRTHPYASPARAADHRGLPPALVQVAEHDPLRDDGLRYAALLRQAGVPVRETTYVGMPHGYLSFPGVCRGAPQAMAEITGFLQDRLGTRPRL